MSNEDLIHGARVRILNYLERRSKDRSACMEVIHSYDFGGQNGDGIQLLVADIACIPALAAERDKLRADLATAVFFLGKARDEIDAYIRHEYPADHPVHERYRQRDFAANPARVAMEELRKDDPALADLKGGEE